jgi:predicted MPP superfamily phosphohydrolase
MLLAAWTLLHGYVFWRAATVPAITRRVPHPLFVVVACVMWASLLLVRGLGRSAAGPLAYALELFGMNWMAMLFLAAVALLAVDLVTGFGLLMRHHVHRLRGWALIAGGILSAIAIVQGMRPPVVSPCEITLAGLPASADGTVIVAVSNLHVGSLLGKDWLTARVEQIEAERPDIIVLLGDIVEGHGGPADEDLVPILSRLSAPLGIWAVTGNHEYHRGRASSMSLLEEAGARVLHDRSDDVRPGLVIAGVDDLTSRYRSGENGDFVSRALAHRPPGATVLLSHTPWQADSAAREGTGLMLCGHTHGGQVWPFGLLVRTVYPLLAGRYVVDGMPVIVCRGTGTWGPRMRLWRPGEILRITLRAP